MWQAEKRPAPFRRLENCFSCARIRIKTIRLDKYAKWKPPVNIVELTVLDQPQVNAAGNHILRTADISGVIKFHA